MAENSPRIEGETRQHEERHEHQSDSPRHQSHRERLLLEATDLVVRVRSLPDLFKEFAPRILTMTACEFVKFSLHDPEQNCMITHYWKRNQESGQFDAYAVDECLSGWVWMHQEAVTIPDIDKEKRLPLCMQALHKNGVHFYSMLPLTAAAHRFGALGLGKSVPEVLASEDLEFYLRVASVVVLALENQEARRVQEQQRERLQALVTIGRDLTASLDLECLTRNILNNLHTFIHHDYSALLILEDDGKSLRRYAAESTRWEALRTRGDHVPLKQALSARAIETRSLVFWSAEDIRKLETAFGEALRASGIQSLINIPLLAADKAWGTLNLGSTQKDAFNTVDAEYLQQVANLIAAAIRNASAYHEIAQLKDRLASEKRYLESEIHSTMKWDEIVGHSAALKRVLDYASIVATTDSTVLITGETGTGKERVARSIHSLSRRKERSFIKLNCAAIPTGLLESELFGHEKGAFTGAVSQKIGRLELADKGTLFLDEIGEIALELQPKLLRVLQDQEFERLGGTRTIRVDARLIAATNRDLAHAVEEKQFRSDLFYGCTFFRCICPRCATAAKTFPRWSNILWRNPPYGWDGGSSPFPRKHCKPCSSGTGPATYGSWRISLNAR